MAEKEMRAKITADDRDFNRKTNRAKKQGKSFGQSMVGVAKMIGAAFVLKKAYDGIKRLIGGMMEMADRLLDLKDITGMSTDELQEWQYVAKIAGVNSEAVANAAQNLTNRFQNLYREQSPISRGFREMGVEAFDAAGELRNTGEIVDEVITELAGMESETRRNALGAQLFGGSWKDLAPILGMGAEGIEKLKQEARDLGIVMDKEAIEAANELRQSQVRLQEVSASLGREIGIALTPVLTKLAEAALETVKWFGRLAAKSTAFRDPVKKAANAVEEFIDSLEGLDEEAKKEAVSNYLSDLHKRQAKLSGAAKEAADRYDELSKTLNHNSITLMNAAREADALQEEYEAVSIQIEDFIEGTSDLTKVVEQVTKEFNENTASIRELDEEIKALEESKKDLSVTDKEEIARINDLIFRYNELKKVLEDYRGELERPPPPPIPTESLEEFIERLKEAGKAKEDLKDVEEENTDVLYGLDDAYAKLNETIEENEEAMNRSYETMDNLVDKFENLIIAAERFGEQVMWAAVQGEMGLKDFSKTVANTARDNIKAYLAEAIAATIKANVGLGPFGVVLAGIAAGAAAALFNQRVPAFAQGGAVSGPTLALVGEGPGVSRSNPEFIGTAKQMGQMGQMSARYLKISKGDLVFAINESQSHSQRSY